MTDRRILTTFKKPDLHWVGDGFLTQSMMPYQTHATAQSPFLIAGYNPAMWFDATTRPRGVGLHPHRGFETVTIVYQGGVEHGDTMGNRGKIGPGEVQWMTAARGVQHEEFHSDLINENGGMLEMVQLWVNLPARHKMEEPRYQSITATQIPEVALDGGGQVRVIAGEYEGVAGPAQPVTPLRVLDAILPAGANWRLNLPEGESVSLLVLRGKGVLNNDHSLSGPETVIFTREAGEIRFAALEETHLLVLAGEPLNEPLAMGGPFVMNTEAEVQEAYRDFRAGKF